MDDLTSARDKVQSGRTSGNRQRSRWHARLAVLAITAAALLGAAFYWYTTRNLISTDDAFTDGRAIAIAPQVAGVVTALDVTDNQRVRAGQVLLRIDPRPFAAARDQAVANLQVAEAAVEDAKLALDTARISAPARLAAAMAQRDAAAAVRTRAEADYRRQLGMPRQATTQEAIDAASAARLAATAQVAEAAAAVRQADTVRQFIAQAEAAVRGLEARTALAKAALEQANLNLAWAAVRAPQDGWITRRNVDVGAYVQPGQTMLAIVTPDVWVTANFKETQLGRIRPGQIVELTLDAYPGLRLHGHVDSIQLGSGARFTAFPPENATGNFVKIVQRVPVKIVIDSGLSAEQPLPLGVSVVPTIRTDQ